MKQFAGRGVISGVVFGAGVFLFAGCASPAATVDADRAIRRSNPIVSHMFTADPSAHVWEDGRLYIYPSTDVAPAKGCSRMDGYHVFSTDDMVTFTDHGEILHSRDVKWGRPEGGFMWAPDCVYKDGTYYYYFPHPSESQWNDSWKIGIATSKNPTSGFTVQGYMNGVRSYIDPCVFIDDDGQAYFIQGGSQRCFGGKLQDNMTDIEGEMHEMTGLDHFHEGAWLFKRGKTYYMVYPGRLGSPRGDHMLYATSQTPLGPWDYKGAFIAPTGCGTMHGSVVKFKGQWYAFYHNSHLSGGNGALRSICFDKLFFNEDGSIQMVKQTLGVELPTLHADVNFNQMAGVLAAGEYNTKALKNAGIHAETISSIQIPKGFTVELFAKDNLQGESWTLRDDQLELSRLGCDNAMVSARVTYREPSKFDNKVRNHSFEKGSPNYVPLWGNSSTNMTRSADSVAAGAYALKYSGKGSSPAMQKVTIEPNTDYELSVWMRRAPGGKGAMVFDTFDAFDDTCQFVVRADQAGEWIHHFATFHSGDHRTVRLRCFTTGDFEGTCYWDQIELNWKNDE
jgi:hypothetical protein